MAFEINPAPTGTKTLSSLQEKEKRLKQLLEEKELKDGLPFLYGWKWYKWAHAFFVSQNKINLLCAANQISKSSTQIRKCIDWATNKKLWPELWVNDPVQFWYLYPSQKQVNAEWETKWKLFMPRGKFQNDPYYGWVIEKNKKDIVAIHFNSGVHVYFKTYSQNAATLQTGTCDAIFTDEELPIALYEELMFRLAATDGYFHMVFTATLGQDFWRRAMEPEKGEEEVLPLAFKQTVSLYDSQKYMDGTESQWTAERIGQISAKCSTNLEVLKRVYGKFILIGGRKYESFDIKRHVKPHHPLPKSWFIFCGADSGSGGDSNHPAALCYVAVSPDFRQGRVFLAWRGDDIETTSGDLVEKHIAIKKENNIKCMGQYYDWSDKDFEIISNRMGEGFEKADKSHEVGEGIINTLFKNDMMFIYEGPETSKLATELATLRQGQNKRRAKDDLCDSFRYCVAKIPWDFSMLVGSPAMRADERPVEKPMSRNEIEQRDRRRIQLGDPLETNEINKEYEEWNDLYG